MRTKSFLTGVMLAAGLLMGCGGVEATPEEHEQAKAAAEAQAAETGQREVEVRMAESCWYCICDGWCLCIEVACEGAAPPSDR